MKLRIAPGVNHRLQWFCRRTNLEVSCIGVLDGKSENLCLIDTILCKQEVTVGSIDLDGNDLLERQIARYEIEPELEPWQMSVWIHTHPSGVNGPSGTDETTMRETFGLHDMAIMLILTHAGVWYARCDINHRMPTGERVRLQVPLDVTIDYSLPSAVSAETLALWETEFSDLVTEKKFEPVKNWKVGGSIYTFDGTTGEYLPKKKEKSKAKGKRLFGRTYKGRQNLLLLDPPAKKEAFTWDRDLEFQEACEKMQLEPKPESYEAIYGCPPPDGYFPTELGDNLFPWEEGMLPC